MGLVCKQLPCWSSEWAVLRSSIFVSGVPCAKPKSTKAYLKRHKFRIRSHKRSINHSIYYSLLFIFLSHFIQFCLSVLLPASQSYFLPSPPSVPSYPSPRCFYPIPLLIVSCPKIFECILPPKVLKRIFPAIPFCSSSNPTALTIQPAVMYK